MIDKSGKILFANKSGSRIITKWFDVEYKSKKTISLIYELVHESTANTVRYLTGELSGTISTDDCLIGILQNLTCDDETLEHRQNVGNLIFENKLVYYRGNAFQGNWKTGNWFVLTLENMMGQLIKNKIMLAKSSFVLSSIENCMSNFEEMYNMNSNMASIPNDLWIGMWSNLFQTFANFSNINTISGLSSDNKADAKIECINLIETIENLTKIIWMSNANHEYDINLHFDQGIPDKLYGNAEIIKQVLTVLFCFAVKLSAADTPTTCTVRFLRMQNCDTVVLKTKTPV